MADYSDYYTVIARAISGLPGKTDEARHAIYERARAALQERLPTLDPPISETDLAVERFALEAAIQRLETESRFGDTRRGLSFISTLKQFVRSGSEFIQRTQPTALERHFFNIFGGARLITKYSQNRIALRLIVVALLGVFVAIFVHWITAENSSIIAPSELALSDVTLSQPPGHSRGSWEVKGVVKNNSPGTVTGLWLMVTIRDCSNDSPCAFIGEAMKRILINVPPSQTRIIDEGDLFPNEMLIPEKLEWSYEIVQVDAK